MVRIRNQRHVLYNPKWCMYPLSLPLPPSACPALSPLLAGSGCCAWTASCSCCRCSVAVVPQLLLRPPGSRYWALPPAWILPQYPPLAGGCGATCACVRRHRRSASTVALPESSSLTPACTVVAAPKQSLDDPAHFRWNFGAEMGIKFEHFKNQTNLAKSPQGMFATKFPNF